MRLRPIHYLLGGGSSTKSLLHLFTNVLVRVKGAASAASAGSAPSVGSALHLQLPLFRHTGSSGRHRIRDLTNPKWRDRPRDLTHPK